ncbi:MAG: hypothetical protein ACRD1L_07255 [Terriglobales bacterium]
MSRAIGIVLALAIAAVAAGNYFWLRHTNQGLAQNLAALQQQAATQSADLKVLQDRLHLSNSELAHLSNDVQHRVSTTQAQLASTQQQTRALAAAQQQAATDLASVKEQAGALNGQVSGVKGDVSTNQKAIAQTQADLEATKAKLTSTIGDLGLQSGLIATTRGELDTLEKSGQRSYFEFKLTKTKQPVRVGAISLQVKKIDAKHEKYTLEVYADDAKVEKKDKTLNEPVQFLVGSTHALNELVVYQMDKNTLTGYVSAPKFPGQTPAGNQ